MPAGPPRADMQWKRRPGPRSIAVAAPLGPEVAARGPVMPARGMTRMTQGDGTMQIGTFLPTYWASYGTRTLPEAITATAQAADALGYASLWANDHVIAPADQASMGHIIEPLITLASVAALVPRLALGTSALVLPQRHAVLVAKQVASLDVLSNGRVILGIGVGWLEEEFRMLDANFAHRGAVADEAIAVLRGLAEAAGRPRPTVAAHLRLWIGEGTQREAHVAGSVEQATAVLEEYRR